ncbi:hypothetical protein DM02DRAFT_632277 [Periconia macrospinosa]|uniref:Uncharacterized protein n=1 Tax=Periconia macrospinosa TaxID=97972 RepID=A0A2V1DD76_9PLEO|nr:hypothetical protein DM02DRAFT_632277 [Periconia macrospinosa]
MSFLWEGTILKSIQGRRVPGEYTVLPSSPEVSSQKFHVNRPEMSIDCEMALNQYLTGLTIENDIAFPGGTIGQGCFSSSHAAVLISDGVRVAWGNNHPVTCKIREAHVRQSVKKKKKREQRLQRAQVAQYKKVVHLYKDKVAEETCVTGEAANVARGERAKKAAGCARKKEAAQ